MLKDRGANLDVYILSIDIRQPKFSYWSDGIAIIINPQFIYPTEKLDSFLEIITINYWLGLLGCSTQTVPSHSKQP